MVASRCVDCTLDVVEVASRAVAVEDTFALQMECKLEFVVYTEYILTRDFGWQR